MERVPGEVVLDLGSGGGIDVLLSARRVGPTGKAYGLDMTDQMLALAEENKRKAGAHNVSEGAGCQRDRHRRKSGRQVHERVHSRPKARRKLNGGTSFPMGYRPSR